MYSAQSVSERINRVIRHRECQSDTDEGGKRTKEGNKNRENYMKNRSSIKTGIKLKEVPRKS